MHRTPIQIRFSDIDILNHINNAKFPSFMEIGRIQYFQDTISNQHNWKETGVIVANYTMDFRIPIYLNDRLFIETEVTAIGTKSITFAYRFVVEGDAGPILKATGTSVLVCFHYIENRSMEVPALWRNGINRFQNSNF
jgi:acyl-CoA thioester hydrolase